MEFPVKVFEIKGCGGELIGLDILQIYGFPHETSFRGGYDVQCRLNIRCGIYGVETDNYFSSTGDLQKFYDSLNKCYNALNGKCEYSVYVPENDLNFEIVFKQGKAEIKGSYKDDPARNNVLHFEFASDQSYFSSVLSDLKKALKQFSSE